MNEHLRSNYFFSFSPATAMPAFSFLPCMLDEQIAEAGTVDKQIHVYHESTFLFRSALMPETWGEPGSCLLLQGYGSTIRRHE